MSKEKLSASYLYGCKTCSLSPDEIRDLASSIMRSAVSEDKP